MVGNGCDSLPTIWKMHLNSLCIISAQTFTTICLILQLAWLNDAIFNVNMPNFDGLKQSLEKMEFVDVAAQLPQNSLQRHLHAGIYNGVCQGDGTEPPSMLGEETTERIEQTMK